MCYYLLKLLILGNILKIPITYSQKIKKFINFFFTNLEMQMFLITVLKGFRIISNLYLIINVIISFKIHLTPLTQIHKPKAFSFHRKISFNKCYYWLQVFVFIVTWWHDQIYEYYDINNNKKMSTHDAIMANNSNNNSKN